MASYRSTYSLSSILLLVACVAVLLAVTRSAVMRLDENDLADDVIAGSGIVGGILGIAMGVSSGRYLLGSFAGFCVGCIVGGMAGAQLAAPPDFPTTLIGICVLLTTGFALRRTLDRQSELEPQDEVLIEPDSERGPGRSGF